MLIGSWREVTYTRDVRCANTVSMFASGHVARGDDQPCGQTVAS